VARAPEPVALVSGSESLTYAQLNARANRLARHLRTLGVGPDVLVGLCSGRNTTMVVALLAILKAGGAYVPLDPTYPTERLRFMVEDAHLSVLLTEERLREALPSSAARVVCLDSNWEGSAAANDAHLEGGAAAANLAYVIYTSGSTGRPKGVQVTHAALANLLQAMRGVLGISQRDALLAVTTLSFDIAALEIFLPLIVGARVELIARDVAADGARLAERLDDPGITFMQATPATWRMLLEAGWRGKPGLQMLCGGEAMPRALADRLLDKGAGLWNLYGPTETTVWSSVWRVEPGEAPISIGRPIANTRLYVLDKRLRPVPVGVIGELHIGGAGVARGYCERPGLTAERFIPDPFGTRPGGRLYRSGDLARWRADGTIECLGRVDHQVKIRGFRVELGEIEAALARHAAVRAAAVAARPDGSGEMSLAAYIVLRDDDDPSIAAELRRWLMGQIPEYMVPAAFVSLDALPLTPNGKVDRQALPDPAGARFATSADFVAPRGPVEALIAGIWADLLGVDQIGASDSFFDLGGHSLLATQVTSRLRDALGVELALRELFGNPTLAELARRVEERRRAGEALELPRLEAVEHQGPIPASFSQQSLWFLEQLAPGEPTFNIALAARVQGPLDLGIFERCLAEIMRRHASLRTTFGIVDDRPVQVVAPAVELPLTMVDLRALDEQSREAEARRLAREEARRPFDLTRGPLLRVQVLLLASDDHAVLLTMHHIISDGWSFGVAARELATLYDALRRGAPSPLDPLPIQYTDYALWQRHLLESEPMKRLVGYWSRQLAGLTPLELPTDRPRPTIRTARGALHAFQIPAQTAGRLRAFCRREGASPFMFLLAAFQTLLYRYSGQDDIVVGSPIANRNRSELEGLIGYFVNMLALRTDLSGDPSFLDLLERVRNVALAAYEHQDLPFETVIETLAPPRDPSRTPLFQVMFVLQNQQLPDLAHPELRLTPLAVDTGTGTAKFDLTLTLEESDQGFFGSFEYNTDLFDSETIVRLSNHFQALVGGIIADPNRRLSCLPLIGEEERRQLFANGGRRHFEPSSAHCVHRLFEVQAEHTPDAVAVVLGGQSLTYRELTERSNKLAHELRARGVGPDVLVGIGLRRSPELAVGLLGILKAGGAFVTLDPSYPRGRLANMLEDSQVRVLLTQEHLEEQWPALPAVIHLDADWEAVGRRPSVNIDSGATRENAAYVMYTSGSTRVPAGVVVRHGGLVNHNLAVASLFELSPADRVLQFSSLSFDIAIEELFPAWLSGATVVFRDEQSLFDPSEFSRLVDRERITVLDLPTAYWHAWVEGLAQLRERLPATLRLVVVGGEKASARRFADWRSIGGDRIRWINTYGPTEGTVVATAFEPHRRPETHGPLTELPIGHPIVGTDVYLLDTRLELVPLGLPGELYLGGEGLARCYLGRPGLTADRFVPHPFCTEPGARLFRTGDKARWRSDGQLEFLGRVDDQVKIRGFRVEPGEVEAALRRNPWVGEAVVLACAGATGSQRLVAYVVPQTADVHDAPALRRWLQGALPDYMIPSAFMFLETLPLSSNGKIDRKALPAPGPGPLDTVAEYVAPRTPLEETLARVWSDVLGLERIGVQDNFFDLGGHSLQTVQLVARLTAALGRPVAVKTVFQAPTVAAMADTLEREAAADDSSDRSQDAGSAFADLARRLLESGPPALPEHVSIERRPFLPLLAAGELASVESVALGYLPSDLLRLAGLDRKTVIHDWFGDRPLFTEIRETRLGRIGSVLVPRFDDQLYDDRHDLEGVLADAVRLAHELGAATVSLTGLLPSACDYGRDLAAALAGLQRPRITTGHATTTAAVVLAVRRALEESGRAAAGEHIGLIGLGSVGIATLRLLLSCLPHPARLSLCDVYSKRESLESLRLELTDELAYRGDVRLLASRREVPDELYECTLIIGATNVAGILDVGRLAPGTIVVDDSAPHAFEPDEALRRFHDHGDILVTEGGVLLAPEPLPLKVYVPDELEPWLKAGLVSLVARSHPRYITGCVLSGLLSARFADLAPTIGFIERQTALAHYQKLEELGFEAADLHLDDAVLDAEIIGTFRSRYGTPGSSSHGGGK
jgi:amino acid adenylation domain-containing protein